MASGDSLGGLSVSITGDFSQLQDAINSAVSMAERGGEEIASAFQGTDFSGLATSAEDIVSALRDVTSAAGDTQLAVEALTDKQAAAREAYNLSVAAYNTINDSLQNNIALSTGAIATTEDLARAQNELSKAAKQAGVDLGTSSKEGSAGFHSLAEAGGELVSTLKEIAAVAGVSVTLGEIAKEAIEAYAAIQSATVSLTALSGSASFAAERIEQLKNLAQSDALAFPSLVEAQQKMTAFGFSAGESAKLLQNAADSAKATGNSFDQVANSLDRIAESGQISGRFLIQLGLNVKDVADVMGVAQDKVAGLFKEMDVSDRILILSESMQKFAGVAAQSADTVAGHWQQFQNAMDFALEQIGETIAPELTFLIDTLKSMVGPVSDVGAAFLKVGLEDFEAFIGAITKVSQSALSLESYLQSLLGLKTSFDGFGTSFKQFAQDVVEAIFHFQALAGTLQALGAALDYAAGKNKDMGAAAKEAALNQLDYAKVQSEAYVNINGLLDKQEEKQKAATAAAIAAAVAKAQAAEDAKKHMVDLAAAEDSIFARTETMAKTGLDNLIAFGNATKGVQDEFVKLEDQIPHTLQQFQDLAASGVNFNKLEDSVQGFLQKMKDAGLEGSLLYTELEQDNQDLLQYMTDTMYGMDKVGLSFQAAQVKVVDGIAKLIQAEDTFASKKPFDQFSQDLQQLGITVDGVTIKAGKDFAAFDDLTKQNIVTTEELSAGWNKLQKDIKAVANDPGGMEKVVSLENDYLSALDRLHAPLQEQLALTVALAQKNLDIAETQGTSATNVLQMGINLEIAKVKQAAFNDQLTGSLNLFNDMTKSIGAAWTAFGTGIADAITGSESFGQAMSKVLADLEKKLTELVVNYLLGQLKDAFLQNTNALKDFGETFSSIFGSSGSSSGGVGGAASGITGGVQQVAGGIQQMGSGIIGALSQTFSLISSIGSLISSIIQNFQLAHIENVLGEIEQSTRRLDISYEGSGLQYAFETNAAMHDLLGDFRGWFHDAFASLMSTTEDMDTQLQKIAISGVAAGGGSGGGGNVGSPSFGPSGGSVSGTGAPAINTGDQTTFSQTGTSTAASVPIGSSSSTASSPAGPNPDTGQLGTPKYSLINGAWVATGVNSGFSSTPAAQQGATLPAGQYATYSAALAAAAGSGNIIVAAPGGGFDIAVENKVTSSDANSNPAGIANLLQNAGFNSNQIALYLANVAAGSGAAALTSVLSSAPSSFTSAAINPKTGLPEGYSGPTPTTGLPSSNIQNASGSVPTLVINFAGATIYGSNGAAQVAQQIFNVARTSGQLRY